MSSIEPGSSIHFMGIGGIGVSGLARVCVSRGYKVSGCDHKKRGDAKDLTDKGVQIFEGHHPKHILQGVDVLVYSSAVEDHNAELLEARARGLRVMGRGEFLAEMAASKRLIAVAGSHGKTTTSGMAGQVLLEAQWDPTVLVGGIMLSQQTNAHAGEGQFFVAETDESDGSFLRTSPHIAIITNVDKEHLNYYETFDRLVRSFQTFIDKVKDPGSVIACIDDPVVRKHLYHRGMMTYGTSHDADVTAEDFEFEGSHSTFRVRYRGRNLGKFRLRVPGRHNILNALAVISLAIHLDISLITVRDALWAYRGTKRRFQMVQLPNDIWIVEDYAHHPSEIRATLDAAHLGNRHRLVVFQPHRYSRTQSLESDFAACFQDADGVIVTDIYSAFEANIPGVSGERLAHLIQDQGHPCVRYVPKDDLSGYMRKVAQSGDTIFFLGAGDIGEFGRDLAQQLHTQEYILS